MDDIEDWDVVINPPKPKKSKKFLVTFISVLHSRSKPLSIEDEEGYREIILKKCKPDPPNF